MMKNPDISVIVPIYNVGQYLEQCLTSLVNQTHQNIEFICINDGSTDNCPEILNAFAARYPQIRVIDKPNGGYGAAVNTGLDCACGHYIGIVEPDDYIAEDMYATLYEMAREKDFPDIVRASYWNVSGEDPAEQQVGFQHNRPHGAVFNVKSYPGILCGHPSVWSCIYRRDFLQKHRIRMVEAKGAGWVDNPFFYETSCLAERICWIEKPVYYYRVASATSSSILKDCSIPLARMNEIFDFLQKGKFNDPGILIETYYRVFCYLEIIENNPNLTKKNVRQIRKLLKRMDPELIRKTGQENMDCYQRYITPRKAFREYISEKARTSLPYRAARKIFHAFRYLKNHGLASTAARIRQKLSQGKK